MPVATIATWVVTAWVLLALPFFERFSANGDLAIVCMKRGVPAPPGVVMEHLTGGRITGFLPQFVCDWLSPEGNTLSEAVPFYPPVTHLARPRDWKSPRISRRPFEAIGRMEM